MAREGDRLRASGYTEEVVDTLQGSRATSTRSQYDKRWKVFDGWCQRQSPRVVAFQASIMEVLSFLQERLTMGRSYSTVKGLLYAIAAGHEGLNGQPLGRHPMAIRFLAGAKRSSVQPRSLFPAWELALVLDALCEGPFEPLETVSMRLLCLKVVLLVALTTTKRVSELQAFSVSSECLRFAQDGGRVFLRPNAAFVPKNLHVPERPVELEAFRPPPFASPEEERLNRLCPVRALRCYVQRTRQVRKTSQLFVTHGPGPGGKTASRPTLSRGLVEAIQLAYTSRGVEPPEGIKAHSTRGVSASWAVTRGVSIQEVCEAANWSTPSTFATFYSLDVAGPSVAHAVLGVADASVLGV